MNGHTSTKLGKRPPMTQSCFYNFIRAGHSYRGSANFDRGKK
jgi:hypothetical protein